MKSTTSRRFQWRCRGLTFVLSLLVLTIGCSSGTDAPVQQPNPTPSFQASTPDLPTLLPDPIPATPEPAIPSEPLSVEPIGSPIPRFPETPTATATVIPPPPPTATPVPTLTLTPIPTPIPTLVPTPIPVPTATPSNRVLTPPGLLVEDIFGRPVNQSGIVLVDWEGQIANPAMKHFLKAPQNAQFPVRVTLTSAEPRLYFDLPSQTGPTGPSKSIVLETPSAVGEFYISIFPDRDMTGETHTLMVQHIDAASEQRTEVIDVHVIDQDLNRPPTFQIHVDFSQDQTGLFDDPGAQETVRQSAEDWTYFFNGTNFDEIAAGQEQTWIWSPKGFIDGTIVTNQAAYTGFLLYAYGIQHDPLHAGGEGSYQGGYQSIAGKRLPLKRSGGLELEKRGNYNTLGWITKPSSEDWWRATNTGEVKNDLYSIAHHEIGHSLAFNSAHDGFVALKNEGQATSPTVFLYQGVYPRIDPTDHLPGIVDRVSKRGAFGNEYHGDMPLGRWLITKLDLLVAEAAGYKLRETSPFAPLSINLNPSAQGKVNEPFTHPATAEGGIPPYNWTVEDGAFPPGLVLDSFTGAISGVPTQSGSFELTLRVRDYRQWDQGVVLPITINIEN